MMSPYEYELVLQRHWKEMKAEGAPVNREIVEKRLADMGIAKPPRETFPGIEFPELKKVQDGCARSARDHLAKEIAQLEEELELTRTRMRELCDVASDWPSEAMNAFEILARDRDAWKEAAVKAQTEAMQLTSDLRAVRAEKDALNERIAAIKVECVKAEAVLVLAVKIMEKW